MKVAINGFGRIGRLAFRKIYADKDIDIVAINDLTSPKMLAHLLKYDSVQKRFDAAVEAAEDGIVVDGKFIKIYAEADAKKLPWGDLDVDIVLECTGFYTSKAKSQAHIDAGAKKVLISAPAGNDLPTIVFGTNDDVLTKEDTIVSGASCTTNCLAPMTKALNDYKPIQTGFMTTIHAYTGDQRLLDRNHKDFRRARAANLSMIPTSTGAAKAIGLVLPKLAGKLNGIAIRVPTPDVSVVELVLNMKKKVSAESVNKAIKMAQSNILGYNEEPLVSIDFTHDSHSSIFDATQTRVVDDTVLHITSWYDNEWGFSNRMCDTAVEIGKLL
jgi:glyceraldehyde 3-phosphate dehydrogenase